MSKLRDLEVGALAARFLRLCSEAERLIWSFRVSRIGLNLQSYRAKREKPSSSAKRDGAHRVIYLRVNSVDATTRWRGCK